MAINMNGLTENFTLIADGLGKLLGQNCEVALFNSKDSNYKLFYSVNNQITGKNYENNMNHYELEALNKAKVHNGCTIFSYTTKDGRSLKAALFILGDSSKEGAVIMIISYDITDFLLARKAFQVFCAIDDIAEDKSDNDSKKDGENITILMERLVSDIVDEVGKPISYLSKEEKVKIVSLLNNKGVFLVRGSVEYVAEKLCVSRYTIYNYLEEIR
ncbi:helix-turn-helix domain-containing protein [Proteiniborus sp. MB09-C3]|uniref:helix-turn-helix transcriptional regulator n=1 Tax=Proteiniborus sp. MB09-C3 TaxID=3050072 RepID=UPI00255514BD|nr:helix-turn-helix domain-containing protein [Proteiniborus sp. MB09-C3]WIV10623.1 helix-turn-helix domain-containing protein [Proteiniborus sp. MB09-C3]